MFIAKILTKRVETFSNREKGPRGLANVESVNFDSFGKD